MIHLDTSFPIRALALDTSFPIRALARGSREDARLRGWLAANEPLGMSAIAWAEFLCGSVDETALSVASAVIGRHCLFTEEMAVIAARLFNGSGRRRGTIVDCMIAATALTEQAAVATSNRGDFSRFAAFGSILA